MLLYVREIRREVERSLRDGAALSDLAVIERPASGQTTLEIRADHSIYLSDNHGAPWAMYPLTIDIESSRQYLIGLRVNFIGPRGQDAVLASASIVLAVRMKSSEPIPIARAEWDSEGIHHAQPHWHIYPRPENPIEVTIEKSVGLDSMNLFSETARIHWAMAANWFEHGRLSLAYEYDFESIESLANWLGGCVGYMKKQLEYLEKKLPADKNFFESISEGQS